MKCYSVLPHSHRTTTKSVQIKPIFLHEMFGFEQLQIRMISADAMHGTKVSCEYFIELRWTGREGRMFLQGKENASKAADRKEKKALPAALSPQNVFCSSGRTFFLPPLKAGLTVEAACILPLFLWAVLGALYLIEVSVVQARLMGGIHEAAQKMSLLSYGIHGGASEEEEGSGLGELAGGALTAVYAKNLILKKAGLEETFLKENVKVSLVTSDFSDKDIIDLRVMSRIQLPIPVYRLRGLKFLERGRVRAWTGRSPTDGVTDGEESEGEMVYVALNGRVYHRDPDCSYIKVKALSASVAEMERKRSSDGSRYYACSCYGVHPSPTVYYTHYGNRYHGSLSCSALKRTAQKVLLSSVSEWKACSKCG